MAISKHQGKNYERKKFIGAKHSTADVTYDRGVDWEKQKRQREQGRQLRLEKKRRKRELKKHNEERQNRGLL